MSENSGRCSLRLPIAQLKKQSSALAAILLLVAVLMGSVNPSSTGGGDLKSPAKTGPAKSLKINLDTSVEVKLPEVRDLSAVGFHTSDGKEGWVLRLPGNRPIATPAYADGLLFVGGGYGSHEFYAFKSKTGEIAWKINTSDDGPTAAVVEGGYVAFNTESCTVIVVDEKTGKVIWQEWLGDPLMSQPAISNGHLFIAYPAGQHNPKHSSQQAPTKVRAGDYRLLAVDLKTGHHLWEQDIPTDVISAPVVKAQYVYVTCFDGTSLALDASTGRVLWKKKGTATSAPLAVGDQIILTRKEQDGNHSMRVLCESMH